MPRRSNRRRKNRGSRVPRMSISGTDRVERVPGKVLIPINVTAFPFTLPLAVDSLGSRLVALGNVFQEHRFTSIRVVLHPAFTTVAGTRTSYAVGYFKVLPLTPPTTIANLYSGAVSRYHDTGDTVPIVLNLNRQTLLNTVRPWFTNNAATGTETLDSSQGVLFVVGSGTTLVVNLEISYMCEFRGATLPAVD